MLFALRDHPEVHDVRVELDRLEFQTYPDDEWPYASGVAVITTLSPEEVDMLTIEAETESERRPARRARDWLVDGPSVPDGPPLRRRVVGLMARELEQVTDALCYHAEGPVWSPTWGGLRWVDMLAGDVLTLRADGSVDRLHVGDVAAFVRPRSGGGWVVATERGLALADEPDGIPTPWSTSGTTRRSG